MRAPGMRAGARPGPPRAVMEGRGRDAIDNGLDGVLDIVFAAAAMDQSRGALNDDRSSGHGVAVPMRDFPLAVFAAVDLRGP